MLLRRTWGHVWLQGAGVALFVVVIQAKQAAQLDMVGELGALAQAGEAQHDRRNVVA